MIPLVAPAVSPLFTPSFNLPAEPAFIPFAPVEHCIPFARVPRTLLNAPGITLRDIKVYAAILSFPANARHERWPGREKIGELTGLPPKVVSRTTTHLQKLGWLAKQGDGGRSRTTRYGYRNVGVATVAVPQAQTVHETAPQTAHKQRTNRPCFDTPNSPANSPSFSPV